MKTGEFLIGTNEEDRLVITDTTTGQEYIFYTPEAAWAFFKASNQNKPKVKTES